MVRSTPRWALERMSERAAVSLASVSDLFHVRRLLRPASVRTASDCNPPHQNRRADGCSTTQIVLKARVDQGRARLRPQHVAKAE